MADEIENVVPIVAGALFPLTALSNLARVFRNALHDTDCVHAASFCFDSDTTFAIALSVSRRSAFSLHCSNCATDVHHTLPTSLAKFFCKIFFFFFFDLQKWSLVAGI